jgi:hypothetical protein
LIYTFYWYFGRCHLTGRYDSYVIRVWSDENGTQTKWKVEHTGSGAYAYYNTLADAMEFVKSHPGHESGAANEKTGGDFSITSN